MPYDSNPDPYIDFETGTLKNLLGLRTTEELEAAEADITAAAITSVSDGPVLGNFDLEHLQNIHWELFKTIYDWAGEIRTVEISKGNTRFANADVIGAAATALFEDLHKEKLLADLTREQYVQRLAYYYSEINVLHPFREGNGRTERTFFGQLVATAGYRIAWRRMDADENIRVCTLAYEGDEEPLARMLDGLLEERADS